ncbi:iron donor protein CyaY [Aquitalea sp. FJL05]|uniref:iron donor protein CyaY n=1 Tax=Aquitalea TaxID=407217 RepID=UPI000F59284C|nr:MULTISPECIES: iron donor protein CyaY [Aquitalea]RQO77556.1 iron donor protein CyaY [Aquitalea sp. FJL05]
MNESEFLDVTDRIFSRIEDAIDDAGVDADFVSNGNVLEIEFDDGGKIVVNRHAANQELWIAAKSGGYHFAFKDGQWLAARDGAEFFSTLKTAIAQACGEPGLELDI